MIVLKQMTENEFESFKIHSQESFSTRLAGVENIALEEARKNARDQFQKLVPDGLSTIGQFFFAAYKGEIQIGFVWLGVQRRLGRLIASINDIHVNGEARGNGYGREILRLIELEAARLGASRIRLHVFYDNKVARSLYESSGYQATSMDMCKML